MALTVIGTGLGRTGTKSMQTALNQLGFGPCHHMIEVIMNPEARAAWTAAATGERDWDQLFAGYHAMVDWPGVRYWKELVAYWPEARVLHTTRDADAWFESTQQSIFSPRSLERFTDSGLGTEFFDAFLGELRPHINDRAYMIDYFHRHEAEVKATVPKERLLVHRASDGWAPLCAFLGAPVPDEPYPSENSRASFAQRAEAVAAAMRSST
jgi:hypothetical protein